MEIWKSINGYEHYYISNTGKIKNTKNNKNKLLNPIIRENKYSSITLYKNNNKKSFTMHRLIAIYFIPNPENKPCVNHINGLKYDFNIDNLEWCTYSENEIHSVKILNKKHNGVKGVKNHNNKLKELDVFYIKNSNLSQRKLSAKFNVCKTTIQKIKSNQSWNHV